MRLTVFAKAAFPVVLTALVSIICPCLIMINNKDNDAHNAVSAKRNAAKVNDSKLRDSLHIVVHIALIKFAARFGFFTIYIIYIPIKHNA